MELVPETGIWLRDRQRARVASAARVLDLRAPGWERRVHVARLDLKSPTCCILGQVFRPWWRWPLFSTGYVRGLRRLATDLTDMESTGVFACASYEPLRKDEIRQRRAFAAAEG